MKTYLIAAAALLAGSAALAQTVPPAQTVPTAPQAAPARPMADHVMTRAETVQMVRDHFAQFDTDKDGAITTAEITALHGNRLGGENGRQMMSHDGPMGDPAAAFDRLDTNKDGAISRDEFTKGREQRIEKRIVMREKVKEARQDGKMSGMRMHRMGGMGGGRMIVMADTNKDGRITLAEAEAMALQHFDQMDSNHDGRVTREERRAFRVIKIQETRAPTAG